MDMHVDDRFRGHRALRRGRVSLPGQVYHVTAGTLGRRPWFADFHVGCEAVRAFHHQVALADARLLAWVLMPDHGHWLLQMGECMPLERVVSRLKAASGVRVPAPPSANITPPKRRTAQRGRQKYYDDW